MLAACSVFLFVGSIYSRPYSLKGQSLLSILGSYQNGAYSSLFDLISFECYPPFSCPMIDALVKGSEVMVPVLVAFYPLYILWYIDY